MDYQFSKILLTSLVGFSCFSARLEGKELFVPWLQTSPCLTQYNDPTLTANFPAVCINARAESSLLTSGSDVRPDQLINSAEGYVGVHFHKLFSYHAKGLRRRSIEVENRKVPNENDESILDESFAQIGNAAYHRPRFAVGRLNMPYGLDYSPLPELYNFVVKSRRYHAIPTYAGRFTYDNLLDTQLELGYGTDDFEKLRDNGTFPAGGDDASSFRVSHDISALGGSRLMIFGYGTQRGERRVGAAFLNKARNGAINAFEWQRRRHTSLGEGQDLQQVFRINYLAAEKQNPRFLFEFEHDHKEYWLLTLGQNYRYVSAARFNLAASYYSSSTKEIDSHWLLTISVGAEL